MWRGVAVLAVLGWTTAAQALDIRSHYSPLNRERAVRSRTDYIVLHTTEGASRGALHKLRALGEAHYLVDERGRVTRIIHHRRIATHAGTAMWDGHRDLDARSLGIEVAGYHDGRLRPAQAAALRELLRQLQSMYEIPDDRVLTHSMVAYGTPHRYHRYRHRGRKRCGMLFGRTEVREALGLHDAPAFDPDVKAGRLRVADRELYSVLFPSRPSPGAHRKLKLSRTSGGLASASGRTEPDGTSTPSKSTPTTSARMEEPPPPSSRASPSPAAPEPDRTGMLEIVRGGRPAQAWVGTAWDAERTIYLFPSGLVRTGAALRRDSDGRKLLDALPRGTRVLLDKQFGGYVTADRPPSTIAGSRWNDPSTLYRLPDGRIVPGHRVKPSRVPRNTLVFPSA